MKVHQFSDKTHTELTRLVSFTTMPEVQKFLHSSAAFILEKKTVLDNITLVTNTEHQKTIDEEVFGEHYIKFLKLRLSI